MWLKSVFAKSRDFNCSSVIESILHNHEICVLQNWCTGRAFEAVVTMSLRKHATALKVAESKLDKSVQYLKECADSAMDISTLASKHIELIDHVLIAKSTAAITVADDEALQQETETALEQNSKLERSTLILGAIAQSLDQIGTRFRNMRLFWQNVQHHCNDLADSGTMEQHVEHEKRDELLQEIQTAAISWLALAHINHTVLK